MASGMMINRTLSNERRERASLTEAETRAQAATRIQSVLRGYMLRATVQEGKQMGLEGVDFLREGLNIHALRKSRDKIVMRGKIREITLYCTFLFFFTFSSIWVVQDQDIFHFGNNIKEQLTGVEFKEEHVPNMGKTFYDVAVVLEFYQWLQGPFHAFVYTGSSHEGRDVSKTGRPGSVFWDNRIVGGIRIGQLRVKDRPCDLTQLPNFKKSDFQCAGGSGGSGGSFTKGSESKEPFGMIDDGTGRRFEYDNDAVWGKKLWSTDYERDFVLSDFRTNQGRVYPTPGFAVILPNANATRALELYKTLIEGEYVDRLTRAVFVDMTVYNPNMDLFCFVRLSMETGKSGGPRVAFQYSTARLYTLFEGNEGWRIALESIVIAFYLYYIVVEFMKGVDQGWSYFFSLGVITHNINLALYIVMWVLRAVSVATAPEATMVDVTSDVFYGYQLSTMWKRVSIYINSLNAWLVWFKLVRFLGYIPRFALVTGTLQRSAKGIGGFTVIFCVLFYGFCAAHMMTFGTQLDGYKNLTVSALTLIQSLLGDFKLDEMVEAQFIMGPLLFVLFTAVAVFVVLNILIAVISDAYSETIQHLSASKDVRLGEELRVYLGEIVERNACLRTFIGAAKKKQDAIAEKVAFVRQKSSTAAAGASPRVKVVSHGASKDSSGAAGGGIGARAGSRQVAPTGGGEAKSAPSSKGASPPIDRAGSLPGMVEDTPSAPPAMGTMEAIRTAAEVSTTVKVGDGGSA